MKYYQALGTVTFHERVIRRGEIICAPNDKGDTIMVGVFKVNSPETFSFPRDRLLGNQFKPVSMAQAGAKRVK